jgi:hypothetical protein
MTLKGYVQEQTKNVTWRNYSYICPPVDAPYFTGYNYNRPGVAYKKQLLVVSSTKTSPPHKAWTNFSYRKGVAFGGNQYGASGHRNITCYLENGQKVSRAFAYFEAETDNLYRNSTNNTDVRLDPDMPAILYAKVLQSLQRERQEWMAAVSLGEGRETMRMIANAGKRLVHSVNNLRKGKVFEAYKHLSGRYTAPHGYQNSILRRVQKRADKKGLADDLGSAWMELSFGWRPLLSDVDDAANWAASRRLQPGPLCRVSRSHKSEWERKFTSPVLPPPPTSYQRTITERNLDKRRVTLELKPVWRRDFSVVDELGFTDPATVAWNLLPLSFVVDWFVNVGQVLESLYEFERWSVVRGLTSAMTRTTLESYLTTNYRNGLYNSTYTTPQFLKYETFTRSLTHTLPTSVPLKTNVSNPFDLKTGQWATLMVLMRYAFR